MKKVAVITAINEIDDLAARWNRSGGVVEYDAALRRHYSLFRKESIKAGKLTVSGNQARDATADETKLFVRDVLNHRA